MSESKQSVSFSVGDRVTYETLDQEYYSRGYGCIMESKASTIVAIYYKMANGDMMQQEKLVPVDPPQSKSEPPKSVQNGSTS